ncbi:MAG: leucine-rich repeat domain-containing protein [Oscillospiraceae bacterium]|nr:leucine-rich repeat domain-containing protein [Oscillospiraceae bacterium]
MRKLKDLLASITVLSCCCASCLPMAKQISHAVIANAEDEEIVTSGTCGENLTWNFEESTETLTISGTGAMTNYTGTFPWKDLRLNIKKVILENGVTTIGKYAFSFCYALESVIIPDSVTTIEECTFYDCSSLESIVISDSVTTIEFDAFENTPWLENKKNKNPFVIVNGILIDGKACEDDIVIPNSVTSIAKYAFMFCDSLTSVTIPNSVTTIGNGAFYGCDALESVTIPDSVTSIGDKVFKSCKSLISIYVDENNLHYSSQDNILFDKNKSELIAFPIKNNIIEYIIPDSVTSITEYAFYMCDALESVTIPDSVTKIGEYAFYDCTSLTSITIENPECKIYDFEYTISAIATIYGYDNSTAKAYAEEYNRNFLSLGTASASTTEINFQNFLFFMLSIMRFLT